MSVIARVCTRGGAGNTTYRPSLSLTTHTSIKAGSFEVSKHKLLSSTDMTGMLSQVFDVELVR